MPKKVTSLASFCVVPVIKKNGDIGCKIAGIPKAKDLELFRQRPFVRASSKIG
jgi:hypothetical protein